MDSPTAELWKALRAWVAYHAVPLDGCTPTTRGELLRVVVSMLIKAMDQEGIE